MSRRNRSGGDSSGGSGGRESRGIGATIRRILKIKAIILLILIVLSVFGVLYIIDWFRGVFSSGATASAQPVIEQAGEYGSFSVRL